MFACNEDRYDAIPGATSETVSYTRDVQSECGCVVQIPDENDPCCYRIKCEQERYVQIGHEPCNPPFGYNNYTIPATSGPGNWTTICSPTGGVVFLYIHSASGRCGKYTICDLFPLIDFPAPCDTSNHKCNLPLCQ